MRAIRYRDGAVYVAVEPEPTLPAGGLLIQMEACGLCSGELMEWYMDAKNNPVLGHEVAGRVIESDDPRFPVGSRVFPHHHAPCDRCVQCRRGAHVQCETWRRSHLSPGGMAERFAVAHENLADTHLVEDLRPVDAALCEPLACVVKSLRQAGWEPGRSAAVIGLGSMGLLHMLALGNEAVGYELAADRRSFAESLGMHVQEPGGNAQFDFVFVCPGSPAALSLGLTLVAPRGTILLFAPMGATELPSGTIDRLYFNDIKLATSYSCGPDDTAKALQLLRTGTVRAEQIVSSFVGFEELPAAYQAMKRGEILKAMVVVDPSP